jgi:hypothetical protein
MFGSSARQYPPGKGEHGRRRAAAFLFAAGAYYIAATFLHEQVSEIYSAIFHHFGRAVMERSVHVVSLLMCAGAVAVGATAIKRRRGGIIGAAALWGSGLGLAFAADALLVVTNIERIHYPQYAVLALLLIPVLPSYFTVLLACTAAGVFDEFMQYVMFPKYTEYLDFNDFILNQAGAGIGIALHASAGAAGRRLKRLGKADAKAALAAAAIILVLGVAGLSGRIAHRAPVKEGYPLVQEVNGKNAFVLSFRQAGDFWIRAEHGRVYHILGPVQGTAAMLGVLAIYGLVFGIMSVRGREGLQTVQKN